MPKTRVIKTEHAPGALGAYSQGIVANGFLFTAGQAALDPATGKIVGDKEAEAMTRRTYEKGWEPKV